METITCKHCNGAGELEKIICDSCKGSGDSEDIYGEINACYYCYGKGYILEKINRG